MRKNITPAVVFIAFVALWSYAQQGTVTVEIPRCSVDAAVPTWNAAAGKFVCAVVSANGDSVPSGSVVMRNGGSCGTGWTEFSAIAGRMPLGTTGAGGDVGTLGGSSTYTPAGTINGMSVADHASHTHNYTDVIAHTHTLPVGATDDTSAPFDRADAGTNAAGANATTASGSTGAATGTTQGTALTHSVTQGNFVGQQVTLTPPYVKLIFCRKD